MTIALLILIVALLVHYVFFLYKVLTGLKKVTRITTPPRDEYFVSVIIPFRNEEKNILKNLESIKAQIFPLENYEVIYVNDNSEDNSYNLLTKNKNRYNIKAISVPSGFSPNAHKKRALRYGIENSKGHIIVTTDADCTHHPMWLQTLVSMFNDKVGFVSAPVVFEAGEDTFSQLQQLEFAGLVLVGAGLIGAGSPTICNAANIAFSKKAFISVNGFKDNMDLSSGDDEFLMQKIASKKEKLVKFCFDENAIVRTTANKTVSEFFSQRRRWASKGLFYNDKWLIVKLVLIFLFYLSLTAQPVMGIFISFYFFLTFIVSVAAKFYFEYSVLNNGIPAFYKKISPKIFLIAELLHVPYIIITAMAGVRGNFTWKGRKLKR